MSPRPNVYLPARELIELGMCPFADPKFTMPLDDPCPICGALGNDWPLKEKCIGDGTAGKSEGGT